MQKEISSGTMLAVVLIAIAAIIGLGFSIFAIAKNTANDGQTDLQDRLNTAVESEFSEFNKTVITGTTVKAKIDTLINKHAAILVQTVAFSDAVHRAGAEPGDSSDLYNNAGIRKVYKNEQNENANLELPVVFGFNTVDLLETDINYSQTSTGHEVRTAFVNYGEILGGLAGASGVTAQTCEISGETFYMGGIYFENGEWHCPSSYCAIGGMVMQNSITNNIKAKGNLEYIDERARYNSYLLRDSSGAIMGVVLQEIVK